MRVPPTTRPVSARPAETTLIALFHWARVGIALAGGLAMLAVVIGFDFLAPPGHVQAADHVALDIMPVKPGGPAAQYPAYVATSVLTIPARRMVTVTIRNFDLDPSPLPPGSPYANVQGTVGGVAYVDGTAYRSLDSTVVAHTFTVPELHLNVPIPGRATDGRPFVTVQFRLLLRTPGVYSWRCFAPCGDGPQGESGPMADDGYMRGTVFVQA